MASKVVAIIPARKGSKRLPGKNKKMFCGKPLICWTIEVALECNFIDEIIVSTDDIDIMKLIDNKYPFNKIKLIARPPELAQDDTPLKDVILSLGLNDWDEVILLQPTSPLRKSTDIHYCYSVWKLNKYGNVVSCSFDGINYKRNGAIYIWVLKWIKKNGFDCILTNVYIMPEERSIDIDTLEDFEEAERIMLKRLEND